MHTWNTFTTQDSNSNNMDMLIFLHDSIMITVILITSIIMYMFFFLIYNKFYERSTTNNHLIELIWTIMPIFTLLMIIFPSLKILYLLEESSNPMITLKAIGQQWYWHYEYSDFMKKDLDCYLTSDITDVKYKFRMLDTDNRIVLPNGIEIRIIVTSYDVIHSWSIPAMAIKMDATPGRINQILMNMNRPGLFFGQCSEICGSNHSFMPICIESTNMNNFINWLTEA